MTVELSSPVDSELILARPSGSLLKPLPNRGQGQNERMKESLTAVGTYTIIATTADPSVTGDFLLTVGAAGSSDFKIAASVIKKDGADLNQQEDLRNFQWKVFTSATIRITATLRSSQSLIGYEFELVVPKSTGLQIADAPDAACDWSSPSGRPVSKKKSPASNRVVFHLVRCGIGDGESVIQLKAWQGATRVAADFIMPVPQAWHDANENVVYRIDCGSTPSLFIRAVSSAARAWNSAQAGVTFERHSNTACPISDASGIVLVKPYTAPPPPMKDRCDGGIACVIRSVNDIYPHLYTQELLIRRVPASSKEWTEIKISMNKVDSDHLYIPMTMIHELGHTAGLGHSGRDGDIMDVGQGDEAEDAPKDNDISAMKSIYQNHDSH